MKDPQFGKVTGNFDFTGKNGNNNLVTVVQCGILRRLGRARKSFAQKRGEIFFGGETFPMSGVADFNLRLILRQLRHCIGRIRTKICQCFPLIHNLLPDNLLP
nr:hypothetical protein [Negativicoccus succinicivorans]